MKNKIFLVAKKEWRRFFTDRRMIISALIFPCVFLYIVYAYLVPFIIEISEGEDNAVVYAVNMPEVIINIYDQIDIKPVIISENDKDAIINGIINKSGNILLEFPENFIEDAVIYDVMSGTAAPEVLIYYNSLASGYSGLYVKILTGLNVFEKSISHKFDINLTSGGDLAEAGEPERFLLASILPVFLLLFIFQGAMATSTEAITGEKERGTLATIFITSVKPMELAAGKIIGLGTQAFLCGISASLGLILSLPKFINSFTSMFQNMNEADSTLEITSILNQYGVFDIILLVMLLIVTAGFIVTLISIIAINAKTAKEAQMFAYPLMIVLLFVSFLTVFNSSQNSAVFYFIPVCSSIQSLNDIINSRWMPVNMAVTIGSNLLLSALGCVILSRLFKTEKIIGA